MFMTAWVFKARHCPTLLNEIKKTKLQIYTSPQAGINIFCAPFKGFLNGRRQFVIEPTNIFRNQVLTLPTVFQGAKTIFIIGVLRFALRRGGTPKYKN